MWHIFWRGYSRLRSGREHWAWMVVVEVRQGTLGGDTRGWGPAGNTGRGWSWLRSGREHWAWMVVVEVRQGTLGVDGRGWGPAGNTVDRGSQLDEDDEDDEEDEEDEEARRRTRRRTRRTRQEEEKATDIKSNNPHLAGGEKTIRVWDLWRPCFRTERFHPFSPYPYTKHHRSLPRRILGNAPKVGACPIDLGRQKRWFPPASPALSFDC